MILSVIIKFPIATNRGCGTHRIYRADGPDWFAENVGNALQRLGHVVASAPKATCASRIVATPP